MWDVETRNLREKLSGHTEVVQSIAFSPDDTRLASAGKDGTLRVWDAIRLQPMATLLGHEGRVWSVAWFADNATLASGGADGTVRLWNAAGSPLERVATFPSEVMRVGFSVNHAIWTMAHKKGAWLWDGNSLPTSLASPTGKASVVAWARAADVLAVRGAEDQVQLCNSAGVPLSSVVEAPSQIGLFTINANGDLLAVASENGEVALLELPDFRLRWSRVVPGPGSPGLEFSPSGRELVSMGAAGFTGMLNVADGSLNSSFTVHQRVCIAVSRDSATLAAGCSDRALRVYDVNRGTETACLQGHDGSVQAVAFSADGRTLVAGTSNGSITFWHTPSWQECGTFKTGLDAINAVAFSDDGGELAIGGRTESGEGKVLLWHASSDGD